MPCWVTVSTRHSLRKRAMARRAVVRTTAQVSTISDSVGTREPLGLRWIEMGLAGRDLSEGGGALVVTEQPRKGCAILVVNTLD